MRVGGRWNDGKRLGAVTVAWRHESGLAKLASPFDAVLPGGYKLAPGAGENETIDIGFTFRL